MGNRICLSLAIVLSTWLAAQAGDWPAFRGPRGDGISHDSGFPTTWGPEENIRWKAALPSPGNASPIVWRGRVFVVGSQEEGKKRSLWCFDRKDGRQLWVRTVQFDKVMPTHKLNPHGSSTPVADGQRVVVWHGSAGLWCYDLAGQLLWSRDLGEYRHMWGYGTSPIIYRDRVIVHCGPGKRVMLTAVDLETGRTLWETEEPLDGDGEARNGDGAYMGSWTTPVVARVDGQDQIICSMPTRVNGYDPETGQILWSCDGLRGPRGDLAYSQPLVANGICVAIGGFRGPGMGFRLGGRGNITETNRLWRVERNPQSIGSGVFLGEYIYRPNAGPGTIDCLEAKTGKIRWTDRAAGSVHWGSIVAADGHLYVTNQKGTTVVFKPNPDRYEEVAQNELDETCNATPALSDGEIFIRTHEHLYCIGR